MIAQLLQNKVIRYIIAGGTAFMSEYVTFLVFFYVLELQVVISNTVSFLVGLVVSFSINKLWVFEGTQNKRTLIQLLLYGTLAVINLAITNVAIYLLVDVGVDGFMAKPLLIIAIAVWNFLLFKFFIFSKKN